MLSNNLGIRNYLLWGGGGGTENFGCVTVKFI